MSVQCSWGIIVSWWFRVSSRSVSNDERQQAGNAQSCQLPPRCVLNPRPPRTCTAWLINWSPWIGLDWIGLLRGRIWLLSCRLRYIALLLHHIAWIIEKAFSSDAWLKQFFLLVFVHMLSMSSIYSSTSV